MTEPQDDITTTAKSGLRMALLVGGILAIEALVIGGAIMFASGPGEVDAAKPTAMVDLPEDERIHEVLVLDDRLHNNKTGIHYSYEVEIYVQVKQRNAERVNGELDQFRNEIKSNIIAIWLQAEPREFHEPKYQTLTRKVGALLSGRFGVDPEHSEPIISKCVIIMGTGFRVDS